MTMRIMYSNWLLSQLHVRSHPSRAAVPGPMTTCWKGSIEVGSGWLWQAQMYCCTDVDHCSMLCIWGTRYLCFTSYRVVSS